MMVTTEVAKRGLLCGRTGGGLRSEVGYEEVEWLLVGIMQGRV